MKAGAIIIGGVILVAAGAGVYYFYQKQISLVKNMTYEVVGISLVDYSIEKATVALTIRMHSQSTIEAEIKGLYLDVYLDNKKEAVIQNSCFDKNGNAMPPGTVVGCQSIIIPAKGYSDAKVSITFSPKLVLGDAVGLLLNFNQQQDMKILAIGNVKVKSAGITGTIPFQYETTIKELMAP